MRRERVAIEVAGGERLDEVRQLWESLSAHHVEVAPGLGSLGPPRTPAESWAVRRAHYVELFADPATFLLLASADGAAVGYALVQARGPEESWETGPVAVLETLAVATGQRGQGIGRALVDAAMAELAARGIGHWEVAMIATNAGARRFYERLDLQPFTTTYIGPVPSGGGQSA